MNTRKNWVSLLLAAALLLFGGALFAQDRMAEIDDAKGLLTKNPTVNNRLRLSTLQYLQGVDYLKAGDMNRSIESLQAAVWTLEDGKGKVEAGNAVFQEARYGLAYALTAGNKSHEALLVLEQLVKADPGNSKARYLLGATLMNIPGEQNMQRAVTVLTELAQNGKEPYNLHGQHAATRLGYNLSTLAHAQGDSARALSTMTGVTNAIGVKGASDSESAMAEFAMGVYLRDSGDVNGALEHLEAAHGLDSGLRTGSGVALSGVLSNLYYAGGLEQLQVGGDSADSTALAFFDDATKVGDDGLDVHHGKAVAHTRLNEGDKVIAELKIIVQRDPKYYDKIKKK